LTKGGNSSGKDRERERDGASVSSGGGLSPSGSMDSREEGMEGGYEAFIEKQKSKGVSYVPSLPSLLFFFSLVSIGNVDLEFGYLAFRSSLRRKSLQISKSLTSYLPIPNTITEMWEPARDFAHLKLPSSGTRCVVGLSGYVRPSFFLLLFVLFVLSKSKTEMFIL
jgi:autophagy-related protein 18